MTGVAPVHLIQFRVDPLEMNTVLSKVQEIFAELFNVDPHSVSMETKASDIPDWDSVGHLSLCGALEEAFEMRFTVNEMAEMNSVGTIVSVIEAQGRELRVGRPLRKG